MEEAEKAAAQLDSAFANTGKTVGLTRKQLDDLASEIQRTTTVSDDLVKEAQALLLSFDQVRGQAFERTIKVAADLSTRLGTDLKGAVRQVGLALQDPAAGLTLLRRSGIAFSDSQKQLIKDLLDTNQAAQAQEIILRELERRFGGAAAASRNTLGGAITGLKNAFGDLFEGTKESTSGLVSSINQISQTLADPRIKEGIDTLLTGFTKLIDLLIKGVAAVGRFDSALVKFATQKGAGADAVRGFVAGLPIVGPLGLLAQSGAAERPRTRGPTGAQRGRGRQADSVDVGPIVDPVREVGTTAKALANEVPDFLRQMSDATRTETERQISAYNELKEALVALRSEGLITAEQQQSRLSEGLDELLPEIDIQAIRKLYIPLKKETEELGEFMKGVWQGVGNSIRQTLSDAIYEGELSLKSLVDVARRAVADILAAFLTSGIKKYISSLFNDSNTGILSGLAAAFGFAAGGGRVDRPTWVGEDGMELATSGRIYNQRQLAFAGAGGGINFAPVTNITVIERENSEQTKAEIMQAVALQQSKQAEQFNRLLARSGVEVRG